MLAMATHQLGRIGPGFGTAPRVYNTISIKTNQSIFDMYYQSATLRNGLLDKTSFHFTNI